MGQYTTKRNGRADERVELLVSTNGELQVARGDALDVQVLGGVASQLEHLCRQILEDSGEVDGSFGADASLVAGNIAEMAFYTATRELLIR